MIHRPKIQLKQDPIQISTIPGDKSISHRAIIIASLATKPCQFEGFLTSSDCLHTLSIFEQLGISIQRDNDVVSIHGQGYQGLSEPKEPLDVGNSGTGIRLITGILAAQSFESQISGDSSIQTRPMKRIIDPLSQMGAQITGQPLNNDVVPPLQISPISALTPITYTLPVASAQVKSAILFASLFSSQPTTVIQPVACRDHTEVMLASFGADIQSDGTTITCSGSKPLVPPAETLKIPADFSSAAFFIALGLIGNMGSIRLTNIGLNPSRTALLDVFKQMGASIDIQLSSDPSIEPIGDITVHPSDLTNIDIDPSIIPNIIDEIPILSIVALHARGVCRIRNASELRAKESDRIQTTSLMIQQFNGKVTEYPDGLDISAPDHWPSDVTITSCHDHRIAMSGIIGALAAQTSVTVDDSDCIQTSFPNFMTIVDSCCI